MADKLKVLSLYKNLLRESKKFSSYNFRKYAERRVKDAFKENKTLQDSSQIQKQFKFGMENLDIIKRQVIVGNLYQTDKLVIEKS